MKELNTLVDDIYNLLAEPKEFNQENVEEFGKRLATHIGNKLSSERQKPRLRMSNLGTKCARKLWYEINQPEAAEKMPPWVLMKFLVGDILEELVLFLAKEAGHTVTDTQKEVELDGVTGHIDGRVDGVLVDVKSAASFSFDKFKAGLHNSDDAFGYLDQLGAYLEAEGDNEGAFIAVDKQHGHITVDRQSKREGSKETIRKLREILKLTEPPSRAFFDEADGKSGNRKLPMYCSYCSFKRPCWSGLRGYAYSNGPKYLTNVAVEPLVPRIF